MKRFYLPWPVYMFHGDGPGAVFGRFATRREAETFCREWQERDPSNLYVISEEPER